MNKEPSRLIVSYRYSPSLSSVYRWSGSYSRVSLLVSRSHSVHFVFSSHHLITPSPVGVMRRGEGERYRETT